MNKQQTLKQTIFKKTLVSFAIPIAIGMIIIMIITYINIANEKQRELDDNNSMIVENLNERISKYIMAVEQNALHPNVTSLNYNTIEPHLNEFMQNEGEMWSHMLITDETGVNIAHTEGSDSRNVSIADKSYFTEPWNNGITHVSSPTFSNSTGRRILGIGAPTYDEAGNKLGVLVGFVRLEYISEILNAHNITDNSYTFMLNSDGLVSGHPDDSIVLQENWLDSSVNDSMSDNFKEVILNMTSGKTGTTVTTVDGTLSVVNYHPVGVAGLSLATVAPIFELYQLIFTLLISMVIVIGITLIINIFTSAKTAESITTPIFGLTQWGKKLSMGDTSGTKEEFLNPNSLKEKEIIELVHAFEETSEGISRSVDLITEVASGNLDIDIKVRSEKDVLSQALIKLTNQLSSILKNIKFSAHQVNGNSGQIASSAQALADGSITQSSEVEQLNASAVIMKQQFEETNNSIGVISKDIAFTESELEKTIEKLHSFIGEIRTVNTKSSKIKNIIKTIEDISFQTNILALNAAVEAARAGAAGKGFAVVADEVRNLASKSAEASQETSDLVGETVESISKISQSAEGTVVFINSLKTTMSKTMIDITAIAETVGHELELVKEIAGNIDQITQVVHLNSATSEETAASSQELSVQAETMQSLVSEFNLKDIR